MGQMDHPYRSADLARPRPGCQYLHQQPHRCGAWKVRASSGSAFSVHDASQLALECGYTAASIRERIYSFYTEHEDGPMVGILFYTAAPDSEGTLGGLVGLGVSDPTFRSFSQTDYRFVHRAAPRELRSADAEAEDATRW